MQAYRIQKQWNSASGHLVLSMPENKLIGTVYMPRGRMWGTVLAVGRPVWNEQVAACRSVEDGAAILMARAGEWAESV